MNKILSFFCTAMILLLASCSKEYDDSSLVNRVDDLENRVTKLEQLCQQMNINISSMQSIVDAMEKNDHVSTVNPISKDNQEIGYTIMFTNGKNITIYHGKDGKNGEDGKDGENGSNGYTPNIGVKQDFDNVYYWTIDNEWLTDDKGNKIKASPDKSSDGQNGTNGQDGKTPQLKIENEYWYVSYDNGTSWTQLGKATGNDGENGMNGDSFFQDVTQDNNNVYFTLTNGTTITIAKFNGSQDIKLTYIPRYSDGKATLVYTSPSDSYVELDFEVSPAKAAANWQNISTLKAVYTETRSNVEFVDMEILSWTTDLSKGIITIQASGKNLSDAFFKGQQEASVRLSVQNDDLNIISSYIPMVAKQSLNLTNNVLITTFAVQIGERYFPENIAGNSNSLVAIDYGDGTLGIDDKHTYAQAGEYTIKFYFENPITEINEGAFRHYSVKSIRVPKEVVTIKKQAFYGSRLENITFEEQCQLLTIEEYAFVNSPFQEVRLPANVKNIGKAIFSGCKNLKNIWIQGNSYYHSWDMFYYGQILLSTQANTPKIIAYAPAAALENLQTATGGSIIIGANTFFECNNIKEINLSTIEKIEEYNFRYCENLKSISLTSTTQIDEHVLNNCKNLTLIDAPDASEIGSNCFCDNKSLTKISLGCDKLTTINTIGNNNESLQTIWIPSGVKTIHDSFNNCASIISVYCKATNPPALTNSFNMITNATKIYVPSNSVDSYKTADGWKEYANMIEEYNFE